jgi:tritrans,polycis-undecaprenyl-diphosphate synthase [geranylgeranyl-diphosphate specific]
VLQKINLKGLIYSTYTRSLKKKVVHRTIPQHVGFILDGNRRGSVLLGIAKNKGYRKGADKFEEVLVWCMELGIKYVSVWIFSTENFNREEEDVFDIFKLAEENTIRMRDDPRVHKDKINIRFSGEIGLLPESLQNEIKKTQEATENYNNYYLNICLAYGGRAEITQAVKKIAKSVKAGILDVDDITEDFIGSNLYTKGLPDPDLIIRTSGEIRLSGFLLWQGIYSELYFTDVYWPMFRKIDLLRAIRDYQNRRRNFGK